tara:strand:+ start:289 stop:1860 length:1572 start_codon:yes stop_codon:yes gene_type:complete
MKSKILSLFLLTAILSLVMVSATDYTFGQDATEVTIRSELTGLTGAVLSITHSDTTVEVIATTISGSEVSFDVSDADQTKLAAGPATGTLTISDGVNPDEVHGITIDLDTYCEDGCAGDELLELDVEFKVTEGFSEDDEAEWYLFDEIEVEIELDNKNDEEIDDIVVEWCLLNVDEGKCTDIEDEEPDFKLKDGDDKKITITFNLDPDEIDEELDAKYAVYVKAFSEDKVVDEDDNLLYDKDELHLEYVSDDISIAEDDFMILGNVDFPETIACGEYLTFNADLWNIVDNDEDDVNVQLFSLELGIDETKILDEVQGFDFEKVSFEYKLADDLEAGTTFFEIRVTDEDEDLYENDNDDESKFRYSTIITSCVEEVTEPTITATLDAETPEAIAGEKVIIKATIKNNEVEEATYDLSVFGNSAWSSLSSIDPQSVTLAAGESKDFSIVLNIDKEAEGNKELTIKASETEQKVGLTIAKSAVGADKITEHLKTNWFIYVIVIVNLILIIAIISVVKRMVGSNPAI